MKERSLACREPQLTRFFGVAEARAGSLQAPASGASCLYWRLRVVEALAPGLEVVHEMSSSEPLELALHRDREQIRVRIGLEAAHIEAVPAAYRRGSPAARAVAEQFGLATVERVEEVLIRAGDPIEAEGWLADPSAARTAGLMRIVDGPSELLEPRLRIPTTLALRPMLLPWALGTAAALLGGVTAITGLARLFQPKPSAGAYRPAPPRLAPMRPPRPVWP